VQVAPGMFVIIIGPEDWLFLALSDDK
jgi:hypothetical protein